MFSALATQHYAEIRLVITSASTSNISYTVTVNNQLIISKGHVSVEHSKEIEISREHITADSSFQRRHKGITVSAAGSVSVMAYTSLGSTSQSAFNVLPYKEYPTLTEYRYYGISVPTKTKNSLMLLVGSDNNTVVQIKPSVNISIPANIQEESKNIIVQAGTSYHFTLHRSQTLLLQATHGDLSGTEVISNNPLSVISGHDCARMTEGSGCDQILAHIPPTVTWGRSFILQPFFGRTSGQLIKVISSENDTVVRHSCTDDSLTVTELSSGETMEFNSISSTKACMISSDKPILVAQLSKRGGLGDSAMMIVPPLEQYQQQKLSFKSLPRDRAERQYVNIIVLSQNFNKSLVHFNDKQIECDWAIVYAINSTENVLAYTCTALVNHDTIHTIVSAFPSAVMVYGFYSQDYERYSKKLGYAYSTGSAMLPLNAGN